MQKPTPVGTSTTWPALAAANSASRRAVSQPGGNSFGSQKRG